MVKTAQAFRPHVLDMFEPQDHPNDFAYPGGPPIPPYDIAGWTLAYQMGVKFDRVLDGFDGPFEQIADVVDARRPGRSPAPRARRVTVVGHRLNDAFIAVNRLLKAGEDVYFVADRAWQSQDGTGAMFVPAKRATAAMLQKAGAELGVHASPAHRPAERRDVQAAAAAHRAVGPYGGSMPSGWMRWILEQFEFPFEVVYPPTLDAGNLNAKYDVLLFPDGGIPERQAGAAGSAAASPDPTSIPAEYRDAPRPRLARRDRAAAEGVRRRTAASSWRSAAPRCSGTTSGCR